MDCHTRHFVRVHFAAGFKLLYVKRGTAEPNIDVVMFRFLAGPSRDREICPRHVFGIWPVKAHPWGGRQCLISEHLGAQN